jgi:hypothetical protein
VELDEPELPESLDFDAELVAGSLPFDPFDPFDPFAPFFAPVSTFVPDSAFTAASVLLALESVR